MVGMRWLMRVLGLVNVAILARLLTPADFGLVAMAMVAVGLTDGLLNVGIDRAVLQRGHGTHAYFSTAWTMRLCQGLFIAAVILAVAAPAAAYYKEPRVELILQIAAMGIAVRAFESLGTVLLRQELAFTREFVFQVCVQLTGVVVTIVLAFTLRSYMALVIGMAVKEAAQTVLSYVFAPYRAKPTLSAWRDLLEISQWSLVFNIVITIHSRLAYLILGRIASADAVGRLNIAVELALTPTSEIASPVVRAFFPGFVKLRAEMDRYRSAFLVAFAAMSLIGSAVCFGFALVGEELVFIVLGAKWIAITPLVQIFAVAGFVRILEIFFVEQVFVFAQVRAMTLFYTAIMVINGLSILPAYRSYDLIGVGILSCIMVTVAAVATGALAARAVGLRGRDLLRCLKRPLVSGAVMSAGVLAYDQAFDLAPWMMLLSKSALGAALFVATAGLTWQFEGRPHGFEAKVLEKLNETRLRFMLKR